MNRLQQIRLPLEPRSSRQQAKTSTHRSKQRRRVAPHRFFVPLHYEKNYAYPLLVWLHGPTGSEFEINHVMPHISMRNYLGAAPRGVVKHSATYSNGDPTFTWNQESQNIDLAFEAVTQCIAHAKRRFSVSDQKVFLVGNGVGGTMALRIALSAPESFAGVASIGGSLPDSRNPMCGIAKARSLPVMIAHCRDSQVYPTNAACSDLRLLHSAGMSVSLRQYPCRQEVTTKMLSDLNVWIMEHVSGVPAEVAVCDDPTHLRIRDRN